MKLKTRERYSMRMMTSIAALSNGKTPVGLGRVSAHSGISRRYLEQLVLPMKHARLLGATSGRDGGYFLARSAEKISLGEIFEAAVGKIALSECLVAETACKKEAGCNCKALWSLINHKILNTLNEHSLADLLREDFQSNVNKQIQSRGTDE